MFTTERVADDGRPVIEVDTAHLRGEILELSGTAVVYEGNVLISLEKRDGSIETFHTQASVGGPGRGQWHATLPITGALNSVLVGEEEMDEGNPGASVGKVKIWRGELS